MKKTILVFVCSLVLSGCKGGLTNKLLGQSGDGAGVEEGNAYYIKHHDTHQPLYVTQDFCNQFRGSCEELKNQFPDLIIK